MAIIITGYVIMIAVVFSYTGQWLLHCSVGRFEAIKAGQKDMMLYATVHSRNRLGICR